MAVWQNLYNIDIGHDDIVTYADIHLQTYNSACIPVSNSMVPQCLARWAGETAMAGEVG